MLLLLQPHGAEQLAKKPTRKMSQTLDRFFKKVSMNIIMKKNICNFWSRDYTATSSIISLIQSDSESDQSTDSLPPSPKQPHIEQEPEVSLVNIDVAYLVKRRSSLSKHEKYNFYCYHFTPDINYKFPCEGGRGFLHRYLRKYSWLSYSWQENGGDCVPCVLFARSIDLQLARKWWVLCSLCALC